MPPFPSFTKQWHNTSYPAISPSRPELSLKGKIVLITGGGTGIGARAVRSFAEAGASHIAILGRRQAKLDSTASKIHQSFPATKVHTYSVDITDKTAVDTAFQNFTKAVGQIDILISNAASGNIDPSIKDADANKWFSDVETNIKGPLLLTQAFLSGNGKEDGTIINVSSGFSYIMGTGFSSYAVSKEAGVRFFSIVGMENPNLRIVSVQPGVVASAMSERGALTPQDDASLPGDFFVWLSSSEAGFLNGKYAWSNWDVDELKARQDEIKNKKLLEMWLTGFPYETS